MRRFFLMILALALVLSGVMLYAQSNAGVEKALQTKEEAGWQAWKDHNAKLIEDMIPDHAINIADGTFTTTKKELVDGLNSQACQVSSYSLSDFSYIWLDKDTVLMTYTANQDATCSGKKQTGKVIATSLWQKKGSKWMSPFHQETAAGSM